MTRPPLIQITDLYHPPQDPDDQFDLATIVALEAFDLKAVILDMTRRFLVPRPAGFDIGRDPGFVPVSQLAYLTGLAIPVAAGPRDPLRSVSDDVADRPRGEQAGIHLLLEQLEACREPAFLSCVGSARVVAAAFNRAPELVRRKTRAVLLNAGSTCGPKEEWNVGLDPAAYIALWRSGLPVRWYPCGTESGAFDRSDERGTHWRATHGALLEGLPQPLQAWFAYGLTGSARGDFIRFLEEPVDGAVWEHVLAANRNLWSTASLVMAAGRELARTPEGWRFVRPEDAGLYLESWPWWLDPVEAPVTEAARVEWSRGEGDAGHRLFRRKPGPGYGEAMAAALNALLRDMPLA